MSSRNILIKTPRLQLVTITVADAAFLLTLMNQKSYYKYIGDRGVRTLEDAKNYILSKITPSYRQHGYGLYLAQLPSGKRIGICGLVKRDYLDTPDLGFALLEEYHGKSLGFEAAHAVIDYSQKSLKLNKLMAITSPDNHISQKLLTKLGFKLIDKIKSEHDEETLLFSLL